MLLMNLAAVNIKCKGGEQVRITLAAARVNAGDTQKHVAEALKITNNTIVAWENGTSEPKISQAKALSELYKMPLDNIIFLPTESN